MSDKGNDLISRQAAIETVKKHYRVDNDLLEVIAYEIEALPSAQLAKDLPNGCTDTISRQAALDALGERPVVWSDNDDYTLGERNQYDMDRLAIETVPSAQPVNIAKLQPNCNQVASDCASDCISRQAALDAIKKLEKPAPTAQHLSAIFDCEDTIKALPSAQPGQRNARVFQGIIVEYPSISAYPEYEGKPYFSIKYTENGQEFIGYGTYKPEVLSEFLKEYFMPLTQPGWIPCSECEKRCEKWEHSKT